MAGVPFDFFSFFLIDGLILLLVQISSLIYDVSSHVQKNLFEHPFEFPQRSSYSGGSW